MSDDLRPRLPSHALESLVAFLRSGLGEDGAVLGLSGGVDSALVARLAVEAVGPTRLLALLLPDAGPSRQELASARAYADALGIAHRTVDLAPALAALRAAVPGLEDPLASGNATARLRMTVLYATAGLERRRVVGTGNKSELLLGYFTKHGDGAADLLPLGDLYKSEVFELAERLGLPEAIRRRPPSAGFWEGQTDEGELGLPYEAIDRVLRGLELLLDPPEIARRSGLALEVVERVAARVEAHRHKRRPAPIPKLGLRTVGLDWRD